VPNPENFNETFFFQNAVENTVSSAGNDFPNVRFPSSGKGGAQMGEILEQLHGMQNIFTYLLGSNRIIARDKRYDLTKICNRSVGPIYLESHELSNCFTSSWLFFSPASA
tara:strand:+ start:1611 stop:1940 length:330 start_codon:yes stop_codon:yes gene_type:complete